MRLYLNPEVSKEVVRNPEVSKELVRNSEVSKELVRNRIDVYRTSTRIVKADKTLIQKL